MKDLNTMEIMLYATEAIADQLEEDRILFQNIGIDPDELDAAEADRIGLRYCYQSLKKKEAVLRDIREAFENLKNPKPWKVISDGAGAVYICPHCHHKQHEIGRYCMTCGERVNDDSGV